MLNYCRVIDGVDGELATPRYLLHANKEVSKSVVHLLGVGVVGEELRTLLAGADVVEDVVVEGSRACCWPMDMACCSEGGAGKDPREVQHLHDPWSSCKHVFLSCINMSCNSSTMLP